VIEMLFGLRRSENGYALQPRFPERAAGWRFALTLPVWSARIDLEVLPGGAVCGEWETPAASRAFEARFGDVVPIEGAS
jgi:hypothetical protein